MHLSKDQFGVTTANSRDSARGGMGTFETNAREPGMIRECKRFSSFGKLGM
jgi:hypothetical protein